VRAGTRHATRGAATGDILIFLATLSIAVALLYPAWSVRGFRARLETAISDVETLSAAARFTRDAGNRWPTPAAPGETPRELPGLGGADGVFSRLEYTLGWTSWEVVDSVEAPPPTDLVAGDEVVLDPGGPPMLPVLRRVGAVTVHSGDETLLAELLEHYSDQRSFVLDTMWVLVLPERAAAPAEGR
jgi:hypothetical protein